MNIRHRQADGLIKLMSLYSRELHMTPREEDMANKVIRYGNYSGNGMCSNDVNYLINNFSPLLYAKLPIQSRPK